MLRRWRKKRLDEKSIEFLFEWVAEKDFFSDTLDPEARTNKLLIEIQKRSLAEQVAVLTWNLSVPQAEILYTIPNEKLPIHASAQKLILNKVWHENRTLFWEDLCEDPSIKAHLNNSSLNNLIVHPLYREENDIDALFVLNHAPSAQHNRIIEFIAFVSSVLALSIQNHRLYLQLKNKKGELESWVNHVEGRIEDGTKKLLEREYQYQALFEGTNDGILVHNKSGDLIEANAVFCRLLGYDKDDLLTLNWQQLAQTELLEKHEQFFKKILSKEKVSPLETTLIQKDGSTIKVELS
ncbi:PAS domain S-box protein, partial [bacterium]